MSCAAGLKKKKKSNNKIKHLSFIQGAYYFLGDLKNKINRQNVVSNIMYLFNRYFFCVPTMPRPGTKTWGESSKQNKQKSPLS